MADQNERIPVPRGQPSVEELRALPGSGVAAVVNFRREAEPDQPLSPVEEGEFVRSLGLDYLHIPVGGAPITRPQVQAFGEFLHRHGGEAVLVHCKSGGRAAVMLMLERAEAEGWPNGEVLERGRQLGLNPPAPLLPLVAQFLEQRP